MFEKMFDISTLMFMLNLFYFLYKISVCMYKFDFHQTYIYLRYVTFSCSLSLKSIYNLNEIMNNIPESPNKEKD